ncbi:DNA-dependent metalloprotease SPRTN isoform X1 [Procambarus clarkii]|uniref:DNA-dependent metalloprotease SPRTN isoform X1 n=2 Tax=Procambarus clarkii TaxID=6728 RepID=UPI003743266A
MGNQDIWSMFTHFNKKYFCGELDKVKVSWSPHMTLCAGKTAYRVRGHSCKSCSIRLSQPLLSQRPHTDTVNTLLHEMIHAYLHVTQGLNYRDSHGPEFRKHMKRINDCEGSKITIYHNFRREVDKFRIHVYRCDGPCTTRRPFFGILRRAIERPPGPSDKWWARHQQECGGTFHKIEGPGSALSIGSKEERNAKRISSSINLLNEKPLLQSKVTNSYNPSNIECYNSDRNMFHKSKIQRRRNSKGKSLKTVQQPLSSDGNKSYNEDHILQRIKTKYSNPKRSILISKEDPKIAYRMQQQNRHNRGKSPEKGTLVDGNVNYNYIARSSSDIDLKKYLNRFYEASKFKSCVTHKPEVSDIKYKSKASNIIEKYMNRFYEAKRETNLPQQSDRFSESNEVCTLPSTVNLKNKSCGSHRTEIQSSISSYQESSSTSCCPICSISVPTAVYEQHIQECFGDDLDMEMDEQYDKKEAKNDIKASGKVTANGSGKMNSDWDELEARNCPNCGSLVLAAEMKLHLEYCIDSDDDDVNFKYESPSKSSDENERILFNSVYKATDVVSCPSCMENIEEKFIQEHLSECLPLLSEEF